MLVADDERIEDLERRVAAQEQRLSVQERRSEEQTTLLQSVVKRQDEHWEAVLDLKHGFRGLQALVVEKERGLNILRAAGLVSLLLTMLGFIWLLLGSSGS